MAKEALEVIETNENKISLSYEQPPFYKRVLANFLDIIFLFLSFIVFFIAAEKIVHITPIYVNADQLVATYREESGLFEYSTKRNTWENVSTWLDNNDDTSYDYRVTKCKSSIDAFCDYVKVESTAENYTLLINDYNNSRLSENMKDPNGVSLFIYEDESQTNIIHNPSASANAQYYYEHFYREYTLTNCGGLMIRFFPEYYEGLHIMSNALFFVQIPISALLSGFVTYLLPTFIFSRGRMTFGKRLMSVGLVDSRVLSPTFWRYLARWAIFFFGEVVLSFFTFGIPFIVSFSMMAFTKRRQGFPDYMLGLVEIDETKQKIYFNKYEVALDHSRDHKDPVKFKSEDKEHLG